MAFTKIPWNLRFPSIHVLPLHHIPKSISRLSPYASLSVRGGGLFLLPCHLSEVVTDSVFPSPNYRDSPIPPPKPPDGLLLCLNQATLSKSECRRYGTVGRRNGAVGRDEDSPTSPLVQTLRKNCGSVGLSRHHNVFISLPITLFLSSYHRLSPFIELICPISPTKPPVSPLHSRPVVPKHDSQQGIRSASPHPFYKHIFSNNPLSTLTGVQACKTKQIIWVGKAEVSAASVLTRPNTEVIASDGLITPTFSTLITRGKGFFSQLLYHPPRINSLNEIVFDGKLINIFELWSRQALRMTLFDVVSASCMCLVCWFNLLFAQTCTWLVEDPEDLNYHGKNQMQMEIHIKICSLVSPMPYILSLLGAQSGIDEIRCPGSNLSKVLRSGKTELEGSGNTFVVGSNLMIDVRNAKVEQGGPYSYAHAERHEVILVLGQTIRPPAKPPDRRMIDLLALESYKGLVVSMNEFDN